MPVQSVEDDKKRFNKFHSSIIKRYENDNQQRINEAQKKARLASSVLKQKYGCRNVILYGSLAWGGFCSVSDIDILIEGFEGNFWQMCCILEDIAAPFEISVVCAEDARPALRDEVFKRGVFL